LLILFPCDESFIEQSLQLLKAFRCIPGRRSRYLLQHKSLVRKGKLHGVLSERTRIGAHIRENLRALGLKRVSHHLTLDEILSEEEPDSEAGLESQRAAAQGQGTAEA
jgi:hypothetical protein